MLHRVVAGDFADVSEVHAAFIFNIYLSLKRRKHGLTTKKNLSPALWLYGPLDLGRFFSFLILYIIVTDRLCGLVVRVPGYRSRGPGFDSRSYQIL
jgi:hypothetical protein